MHLINPSDVFVIDTEQRITQLGIEKSAAQILAKGTTIITARGTLQIFDEQIKPVMEKIKHNLFESLTLTTIRDTLLPKLISGEIKVKKAEKILEV